MAAHRKLHLFALVCVFATLFLLSAGGLVTSTASGLAVPDWPLSYGKVLPPMVGGIFYEHGHRMIATGVGFLTVLLALSLAWKEPRPWVKKLGWAALGVVILQGVLGGLTVLFHLPSYISAGHATLGQIFFCLVTTLAVVTSPAWLRPAEDATPISSPLLWLGPLFSLAFLGQLILGAFVRHLHAGLAIPDFPAVFGGLWPSHWNLPIAIHFLHRLWGYTLTAGVLALWMYVWRRHRADSSLWITTGVWVGLLSMQILLGGLVVLSHRAVLITTFHVVMGASLLATSWIFTLLVHRQLGGWR